MEKKDYRIFPIVEAEVLPDCTLELIKGGGYVISCDQGFGCSDVSLNNGCRVVTCNGYCFVCTGYMQVCPKDGLTCVINVS